MKRKDSSKLALAERIIVVVFRKAVIEVKARVIIRIESSKLSQKIITSSTLISPT